MDGTVCTYLFLSFWPAGKNGASAGLLGVSFPVLYYCNESNEDSEYKIYTCPPKCKRGPAALASPPAGE